MGVKKSMQTFFEAMEGNNLPRTGGKIINTPMGPFTWDNLQESWVNVNNGFRLPNMTVQELMMFGYDPSVDGGKDKVASIICNATFLSAFADVTRNIGGTIQSTPGTYGLVLTNYSRTYEYNCDPPKLKCYLYESDGVTPISFDGLTTVVFDYSEDNGSSFVQISNNTEIQLDSSGTFEIGASNRYKFRVTVPVAGAGNLPTEFDFKVTNTSTSPEQSILLVRVRV
jgi:hypothetical protein